MTDACRLRLMCSADGSRTLAGRRSFSGRNMKRVESSLSSFRCRTQNSPFMRSSGLSRGFVLRACCMMALNVRQMTMVDAKPA